MNAYAPMKAATLNTNKRSSCQFSASDCGAAVSVSVWVSGGDGSGMTRVVAMPTAIAAAIHRYAPRHAAYSYCTAVEPK